MAVSLLRQMPTHNGVAFVAELTIDGRYAGPIENDGNGGATEYFGLNCSPFTCHDLHEYVQACRHRGQPVSEERVLQALVDEYDVGQRAKDAAAAGATLVRLLNDHGYTLDIHTVRPAPTRAADRAAIARSASYPTGRLWQIWTGTVWQHLTDAHPATAAAEDNLAAALAVGQWYRLRYRSTTQRLDRSAVMVYLGTDGDQLLFDARPAAGTQHIPQAWLQAVEPVPADTPPYLNKVEH